MRSLVQTPQKQNLSGWANPPEEMYALQGTNISHLGKRRIIFKMQFLGDMLVPWKVILMGSHGAFFQPVMLVSFEGGINGVTKDGLSREEWNL